MGPPERPRIQVTSMRAALAQDLVYYHTLVLNFVYLSSQIPGFTTLYTITVLIIYTIPRCLWKGYREDSLLLYLLLLLSFLGGWD